MALPKLVYFRDDLRMTTWLLVGAFLQALLAIFLPTHLAIAPALLALSFRGIAFLFIRQGIWRDSSLKDVYGGKWSAQIPSSDGSVSEKPGGTEVVVLLLGARSSHIQGRFAPGFPEIGDAFRDMWRDAAADRERSGFLGKTSTLFATETDSGNSMLWISYWKSLDHLQRWTLSPVHRKGMEMYNLSRKKNPHIGLMHEVYAVPKGHWETVYINFKPIGLGQIKNKQLISCEAPVWNTMRSRMGKQASEE